MDLFAKFKNDRGPLGKYSDFAHGYYAFPKLEGEIGSRMKFQGKEMIVWSVNNYLGLANHPEVRKADAQASADWGLATPMGARVMTGETKYHEELEQKLATHVQKERGLLLNFGYQGIMSIVDTLLTRRDVVVYDKDNHACIYDGIRMHIGPRFAFEHNDIDSFAKQMEKAAAKAEETGGGILVITEGVFGMRGEQGIIKEIVEFRDRYEFRLLVDDAHGYGTLGETGAGAGEAQGVQDEIDIYFSTFAKSMAGIGAFCAGDKFIIDYLRYNLRSQIFAKSLPMPMVMGAMKRFDMLITMPELREKLWENVHMLQAGLKEAGFDIGNTGACVTPVYMNGTVGEAVALVQDLRDTYSIFCSIVVYPVVPKGQMILRLIPTASHTKEEIELTLEAFKAIRGKLESGIYAKEGALVTDD